MRLQSLYYLAGLLEGEGCFTRDSKAIRLALAMTDYDTVQRAATLLGSRVCGPYDTGHKPSYRTTVTGKNAVAWMLTLYPLLSQRRRARIQELLA